jgi:putative glycosyltransferase (TIGR04372 family)
LNALKWLAGFATRLASKESLYSWHYNEGMKNYQCKDASRSVWHFHECLRLLPDRWRAWQDLSIVYSQLIGDIEESLRLLRYARRLRERLYTPPEGKPPYVFLDFMWVAQIGHIANMDHLVKREILLGRDPKSIVLYYSRDQKAANAALLGKLGAHITIVRDEAELPYPLKNMNSVLEEYYLCESLDGTTKHWWHASPEIFGAWEAEGRAPLLALTEAEKSEGRAQLKKLGLPENAWFACLHVRESGFKQALGFGAIESALNAEIDSYGPAIRAVVERGGWVIRVGDAKMRPLPPMPGVIDYARSDMKSEWMDIFLLGACRFFIGTSSGPAYVPPLFGVPCVLTNWQPAGQRPFNGRDLFISKLYMSGFPPRPLRFAEMMAPPVGYSLQYVRAEELGLAQVPNTPDELREVVSEMLDRLDGKLTYGEEDEILLAAFDAVAETNLCIGNARPGRDFLRRHSRLLLGPEAEAHDS